MNGGWAYGYSKDAGAHTDTSVVGWQLQALKACEHTNLKFDRMNISVDKGLKYLQTMQEPDGRYRYSEGRTSKKLVGVGVLCNQMWGKGKSKEVKLGVEFIKNRFNFEWDTADLYSHYYASQAMMQAGGSYWNHYNNLFRDELLKNQNPDGSWKHRGDKGDSKNSVYLNTLCILMLEVYYRFLNTTGEDSSSGSKLSDRPI